MFTTTNSANISIDVSKRTSIQFTFSLTDGFTQAQIFVSISHPRLNQNPELTSEMNIQEYVTVKPIVRIFPNSADTSNILVLDPDFVQWTIPDLDANPLLISTYDIEINCDNMDLTTSTEILFEIIWPFRSSFQASLLQAKATKPPMIPSLEALIAVPYTGSIDLPTVKHYTNQDGMNDIYDITFYGLDYIFPQSEVEDWCIYFKHDEFNIAIQSDNNDDWVRWDSTQGTLCFVQPPSPFPSTFNIKLTTLVSNSKFLSTAFVTKTNFSDLMRVLKPNLLLPSRFLNSTDPNLVSSQIKISQVVGIDYNNQGIVPFNGALPSLYRWKLQIMQTASRHSLNQLQQYIYENERSIYFCVPTSVPTNGITNFLSTSRTNDGLSFNFSTSSNVATSYFIDCYGSVSPFFEYRLRGPPVLEINSDTPPELIPFYLNFSWSQLNSAPSDFTLFYLPPRFMLPQLFVRSVPFSSLFVQGANAYFFYKVTISVAGHTQDVGMNFSVPKGGHISYSHRDPLAQISTSYIKPNSFDLTTFPSLPPMPDVFSKLVSCSVDTSSPTVDTFRCNMLSAVQLNLNIELFLRLSLNLNSFDTYPISGSIVKYHSDVHSNVTDEPLKVYQVPLIVSPISSRPPTILAFSRSPAAGGRTLIKFTLQAAITPQPTLSNTRINIILSSSYLGFNLGLPNSAQTRDAVKISYYYFEGNTSTLVYETIEDDIISNKQNLVSIPSTGTVPFQSTVMFVMITYITKPIVAPINGSDDSDQWTFSYFYTEFFTIQPSCHIPPSSFEVANQWTTSCHNGGKCMPNPNANSYECVCINGFSGPTCDIAPCSQCLHHKNDQCQKDMALGGKCVCEATWSGDLCGIPVACVDVSKNTCKNNGQLIDLTPAEACDTTKPCHCVNSWSDATCSTCTLQCKNGGRVNSKECSKCGCPASFTGETCECQGVNAQFTLNGYNNIVIDYLTALSSTTTAALDEDLVQKFDTVLFEVFEVIAELMNISTQSITKFELSSIKASQDTSASPEATTMTGSSTFKFQISFNCPSFNPGLSQSELTTQFTKQLLPRVIPHAVIQRLFVFPINGDGNGEEPTGSIDPVVETLEPIEESENGSIWYSYCIIMITSCAFFLVTLV